MTHQLGSPLPGAPGPHSYHEMDHVEELDDTRIPRNCPRIHPWCSVAGCTERPLRQFVSSTSKQVRLAEAQRRGLNAVPCVLGALA